MFFVTGAVFTKAEISKVLASTACEQLCVCLYLLSLRRSVPLIRCCRFLFSTDPFCSEPDRPSRERTLWVRTSRMVSVYPTSCRYLTAKQTHTVNYTSFGQILIFVNKLIQKIISAFCFHCKYKCSNVLTVWAAVFLVSRWADCWHEQQRPLNLWCLRTKTETVIYTALPAGHKTEMAFISCI